MYYVVAYISVETDNQRITLYCTNMLIRPEIEYYNSMHILLAATYFLHILLAPRLQPATIQQGDRCTFIFFLWD